MILTITISISSVRVSVYFPANFYPRVNMIESISRLFGPVCLYGGFLVVCAP